MEDRQNLPPEHGTDLLTLFYKKIPVPRLRVPLLLYHPFGPCCLVLFTTLLGPEALEMSTNADTLAIAVTDKLPCVS